MVDWLAAFDDALVGRLEYCTVCGQRLGAHGWFAVAEVGALSLATLRCVSCYAADPAGARQRALLLKRYATVASKLEGK